MVMKRTIDDVKELFKSKGCVLVSDEYRNNKQLLDYICVCGNPHKIRLNDFLRGIRCPVCKSKKISKAKKYSYEYVYNEFKKRGCTLISNQYKGSQEKLEYICECGNPSIVTFNHFINSAVRCCECAKRRQREKMGHSYEFIREQFESEGCILISTEYINSGTLLDYVCSCGNASQITYDNFRSGHRCKGCSGRTYWEYESVKKYFSDNGCKLLSNEYLNANEKLDYICECNNKSSIKFSMFLYGHRCRLCGIKKQSGENNWNWNGGISTISQHFRQKTLEWKKKSMIHSNFKCVITGERFESIHHLFGFDQILKQAFLNCELPIREKVNEYTDVELEALSNEVIKLHEEYPLGVCLTEEVHDEFHKLYGYGNNTPEQFYEFYKMKTGKDYLNILSLNNAI